MGQGAHLYPGVGLVFNYEVHFCSGRRWWSFRREGNSSGFSVNDHLFGFPALYPGSLEWSRMVSPEVWSPDWQHQAHLGMQRNAESRAPPKNYRARNSGVKASNMLSQAFQVILKQNGLDHQVDVLWDFSGLISDSSVNLDALKVVLLNWQRFQEWFVVWLCD